ncbi:hypothetical protein [Blastococcus sp. SYSU DS0617]
MLWFWWWLLFVLLLLLLPLGYGWGYRGWGPPYPSYYGSRRTVAADPVADPVDPAVDPVVDPAADPAVDPVAAEEARGWGLLADVLWVVAVVALVWLLLGLLL